ncbi:MAG: zinc ribbon domain-containing protein [Pyrinomonadaceae bacterium]|nr:zinc ribbon domain-containing protein [Pyrinomonadaceae bacterium]
MSMIQFVNNYQDLSTDKGYQFKFHCDKCGNGFMSQYQASYIGMAGSFLNAASDLLGWGHSAGNSAYEVQRAVGGSAHDTALKTAVEEGKQHFHQCSRCGHWVCPEACWNESANQCEACAPRYEEELAAAHAQAKADAMRQQLYEKAQQTDYVSGVDMSAGSVAASPNAVKPSEEPKLPKLCTCGVEVGNAKFCPECGTPTQLTKPKCPKCSFEVEVTTKFCPECGTGLR